ncbi:MAG: hypothetical protein INF43_04640 [Alphaproteobacteria bacterium]|nr:hypothetical protein [Alphaproteobacteria bacterium]
MRLFLAFLMLLGLAIPALAQQRGYDQHRRHQFHGGGQNIHPYQRGADIVGAGRVQPYNNGGGGIIYTPPQYQQPYYGNGWNNGVWNGGHHHHRGNDAALGALAGGIIGGVMGAIITNEANRPREVYRERPRRTAAPREAQPWDDGYRPISLNQLQREFRCDWREGFSFTLYGTGQPVWSRRVCLSQSTGYIAAFLATDNQFYAGVPD